MIFLLKPKDIICKDFLDNEVFREVKMKEYVKNKIFPDERYDEGVHSLIPLLPRGLAEELSSVLSSYRPGELNELRLRACGQSSIVISGVCFPLSSAMSADGLSELASQLCRGGAYAYTDGIERGYIPFTGGVRIGVVGTARYEGGRMVGVSEISSLVFRFPTGRCDFEEELAKIFRKCARGDMLILSPPGGGKTTALRSLASSLGKGKEALRVVAVDERLEFFPEDYRTATVDILRGYRRREGIELAVRCMSAQVILVDEIGSESDAEAMELCRGVGVSVVATAHAKNIGDALSRRYIGRLIREGYFDSAVTIESKSGRFNLKQEKLPCPC